MKTKLAGILGLIVLLIIFLAVNVFASVAMRGARLDLTESKLYTLTQGSRNIAKSVDEPVNLYFYFSSDAVTSLPSVKNYGKRVRELLEEYARVGGDSLNLQVIDPEPFSEAEDEAVRAGLRPLSAGGDPIYFGLVGTNSIDGREIIPFFDPSQEQFLEYEVSRMIYTLANPIKPKVGVLSSLPVDGTPPNPQMGVRGQQPWGIMREIRGLFEAETIPADSTSIPDDVQVLLIIHPKEIPDGMLYAIDQFVLGGGRAIVFVDPLCQSDIPPGADQNPMLRFQANQSSNLERLFTAWGVTMDEASVAGDLALGMQQPDQRSAQPEMVRFLELLRISDDVLAADDAVTGRLTDLIMMCSGILEPADGATTEWQPLVQTTTESMRLEASSLKFMADHKQLLADFESGDEQLTLAARITGKATTAFPDGPTGGDTDDNHIAEAEDIAVVVVADVDMLQDMLWQQPIRFGQSVLGYRKVSDNGNFVINVLDNLSGSTDLMAVRARGRFSRPFDRVDQIARDAEQKYRAEETELQQKLRDTETKINELLRQQPDGGTVILSEEMQDEIAGFREEQVETRKALRAVRLNLRQDIEKLGTQLRFLNIGLMPAIVAIGAVGLGFYRNARRRKDVQRRVTTAATGGSTTE